MLKIVGGSFGLSGTVSLNYQTGDMFIGGQSQKTYRAADVASVDMDQQSKSKTSVGSILVGLLIITPILTFALSIVGLLIGIVLTVFGSRYTVKNQTATISFKDGKLVRVAGSSKEINKLSSYT